MKIAIATAVYYPQINGVAVFSHNLAVGLAKRGHEVMVICPSQTGKNHVEMMDGVKVNYLKSVDVKVYPDQIHGVPKKKEMMGVELPKLMYRHGLRVSIFPSREVRQALDQFQPEVVHVQVSDPVGLSVVSYARKRGIPVVTTEHNQPEVFTDTLHIPKPLKKPVNYLLSSYFRNRQSKSDFVTMPTERAIRHLIGKGKAFKVPVAAVSNGVNLTHFKPGKAPHEIYEKYGIPTGVPIVLYVGRVDPEKKVGLVIEAFERARKKTPKAEMVIVGDGVDKLKLERMYKNDIKVHFVGRVVPPDLYELYRVGTVFATASEVETQGIVLIEAAATGLPLIAVNKGAVAEVCLNDKNGYLCQSGSVVELAEAMTRILSDKALHKRFATESIEIAHEHDFEKTLDKFENIYRRVIALTTKRQD
ncbi:glycosyltransferase [Candidatus Saccharibacteria bacterium]|nr:glycosyltransferase [Candidatus Saccharibacteria bacterium]